MQLALCDSCQSVGGKLYILGAGWTFATPPPGGGVSMGVAVTMYVDWNRANQPYALALALITQDGEPVNGPNGEPIRVDGTAELGRPPGIPHGSPLVSTLAVNVPPIPLPAGGYEWVLEIDGSPEARRPFWVIQPVS